MIHFPRDEFSRVRIFDGDLTEAYRCNVTSIVEMRRNVGRSLTFYADQLLTAWRERHKIVSLRSEGWPKLARAEAAACDEIDRANNVSARAQARRLAREAINEIRWSVWILTHLSRPDVIAEIEAGPSYEYLRWRKDGRYREAAVMDTRGNIVAEVIRTGGPGPTMRATIYSPPFKPNGAPAMYRRGDEAETPERAELTWALFRQRKSAIEWLVRELHRRCVGIWGSEINLPEYVK